MIRLVNYIARYTRKWGLCANVGATAGMIAGFLLFFLSLMHGGAPVNNMADAFSMSVILTLACWCFAILYMVMIGRMQFSTVAIPALINIFLTVFLTLYLTMQTGAWQWAALIGLVVGVLVGNILCRINNLFNE